MKQNKQQGPKILILDIETAYMEVIAWGLGEQNISHTQILKDWSILAVAAKWLDEPRSKVYYWDTSKEKNVRNDKNLVKNIWKLMNEADVIIGQNSNAFDLKKLNARFILNDLQPPSSYKKVDTLLISRKHFSFTSNKLDYLSNNLVPSHAKDSHARFPGLSLWTECLKGNKLAWNDMKKYNIQDIIATEEVYKKLRPWDNSLNINVYTDTLDTVCSCGSTNFKRNGFGFSKNGKHQRYACKNCGAEIQNKTNLLTKGKREALKNPIKD